MKEIIDNIIAGTREVPAIRLDDTRHCLNCEWNTSYDTLDKAKEVKVYHALAWGLVLAELTCPACGKKSVFLCAYSRYDNRILNFTPLYRPDFPILKEILKKFAPPFKELESGIDFGCLFSPTVQNVLRYYFTKNFEKPNWKIYSHRYFLERCKTLDRNPYSIGLLKYLTLLGDADMKVPQRYARVLGSILELILSPNISASPTKSLGLYLLLNAYIEDNFKE